MHALFGIMVKVAVGRLRKAIRAMAPATFVGKGRFKGFRRRYISVSRCPNAVKGNERKSGKSGSAKASKKKSGGNGTGIVKQRAQMGSMLQGLTKALSSAVHSDGELPSIAKRAVLPRSGKWRGKGAGRRRGTAVDKQLSAIANGTRSRTSKGLHRLTRIALATLEQNKIRLICGQLPVVHDSGGIGTAIDLVGVKGDDTLVLIELKCGHDAGRTAAATVRGTAQTMKGPLSRATDCVQHRHFAQLAATRCMFDSCVNTAKVLREQGIRHVTSELMYVTDADVEVLSLPQWWSDRGERILRACR